MTCFCTSINSEYNTARTVRFGLFGSQWTRTRRSWRWGTRSAAPTSGTWTSRSPASSSTPYSPTQRFGDVNTGCPKKNWVSEMKSAPRCTSPRCYKKSSSSSSALIKRNENIGQKPAHHPLVDKEEKANTKRQIHKYKVKYKDKDNVKYTNTLWPINGCWTSLF